MSENICDAPVIDFETLCEEARGPDGTIDHEAFRRLAEERSRAWYNLPANTAVAGEASNSTACSTNTHSAPANDFSTLLDEACRPRGRINLEALRRMAREGRSHIWYALGSSTAVADDELNSTASSPNNSYDDEDEEVAFYLAPNEENSTDSTELHSIVTPEAEPNQNNAPFQIIDTPNIERNQMIASEESSIETNQLVASDVESSTGSTEFQQISTSDTMLDRTSADAAEESDTCSFISCSSSATDFSDDEISNYQQATGRSVYRIRPTRRSLSESSEESEPAVPNCNRVIFMRQDRLHYQTPCAHADPFRIPISGGFIPVMRSRALDSMERRLHARTSPTTLHYAGAIRRLNAVLTRNADLLSNRTSRPNQECMVPRRGNSVSDCSQCSSEDET